MPLARTLAAYRRTGADPPWGDPLAPHGVAMEGWFWRITDPAHGRVAVVLCAVCRGAAGDWSLVGLATEPGGFVRSAICPPAEIGADGRSLRVPDGVLSVDADTLRLALGDDARLDARLSGPVGWPRRSHGGLGLGHVVPRLGQYWHPHLLGAEVDGEIRAGDASWRLHGALGYAEKNWGAGFPGRWWWGQASGIGDHPDACVAFAGGSVRLGPLALAPTAVVVRLGGRLLRLGPPFAAVGASADGSGWRVRGRSALHTIEVDGDSNGGAAHLLPVPLPDERRVVHGAAQHFAGRLRLTVRHGRRLVFAGESELAALERGDLSSAWTHRSTASPESAEPGSGDV
jgi:hypothetical protein